MNSDRLVEQKKMQTPLIILAIISVIILIAIEAASSTSDQRKLAPVQIKTYEQIIKAQSVLYEKRSSIVSGETAEELRKNDPSKTGLIGVEWSHLVTTPGSYEAKLLSCDPGWGILLSDWLKRADVKEGSTVAIGSSGSFPALMVTARIAVESIGAIPVVVGSMTSSNYGATIPEFDLYAIDEVLVEEKIFTHSMTMLTPGGEEDNLYGFAKEDSILIEKRLDQIASSRNSTEVYLPRNLMDSIDKRSELLLQKKNPKLFINIGGNSANYGTGAVALALPVGYVDPRDKRLNLPDGESVSRRALDQNIPVINLINLRKIALENSEYFTQESGTPAFLFRHEWTTIQRIIALLFAACILAGCFMLCRPNHKPYPKTGDQINA